MAAAQEVEDNERVLGLGGVELRRSVLRSYSRQMTSANWTVVRCDHITFRVESSWESANDALRSAGLFLVSWRLCWAP